ncbi:MAG: hypothetical protein HFJ89_01830 [Oscillospiraceae bacterium]|jgi:adenosylcobinamide kinase/adenosylcobinamide-phosphate guanylyltransferase|nr:hypothetical protein [Oscillospiraceae bacterium]
MSKTILITGGASSGKSRWATTYLAACDYVLYLCAAERVDADTLKRIEYDNKKNSVEWDIKPGIAENPAENFTDHKFVIFDSLASYTSEIIKKMCPDLSKITHDKKKEIEKRIVEDVTNMFDSIMTIDGTMVIITLETGFSITPDNHDQAVFRKILGVVNQRIANMCNEVYLSASGIQFKIK